MIEKGSTVTITAKMGPEGEVKFGQGQFSGFGLGGLGDGSDTDSRWPGWSPTRPLPSGALCAEISGDKWVVGYGATHVAEAEGELTLWFNDSSPGDNKGTAVIDAGKIIVRKPKPEPQAEVSQPKEQLAETGSFSKRTDRICAETLLQHLNANLGHYNRAIWMLMDTAQRRMYLEETLGDNNELLYAIDDIPLTVSGHRVVFPFNGPMPKAEWFNEQNPAPRMSIVTLPTRGLFAEAQLGHCNSCEVRDITRNSDWTEMTTEEPPAISGITPGPRGETPQLTPAQLPANVIQITQPPEAPAPTDVAAALGLLGTPNVFRNMSGLNEASALLGKLADGTISSLAGMRQTASEAKQKVDAARQSGDTSSANGSSSKTKQTPKERYDNLQVAKQLADAASELGLDDQQKAQLVGDIVGDGNGGGEVASTTGVVEGVGTQKGLLPAGKTDAEKVEKVLEIFGDAPITSAADANTLFGAIGTGKASTYLTWLQSRAKSLGMDRSQGFQLWRQGDAAGSNVKRFNFRYTAAAEAGFTRLWDGIPTMYDPQGATNLIEFLALDLATHIEGYGDYAIVEEAEREGFGLDYFFEANWVAPNGQTVAKRSYNTAPNKTARDLFASTVFRNAHDALLPAGPTAWNTADAAWAGTVYGATNAPNSVTSDETAFIRQADFYKFRGRGYIQTTNRANYLGLARAVRAEIDSLPAPMWAIVSTWPAELAPEAAFDTTLTESRDEDWNNLFQQTGGVVPLLGVRTFSRAHSDCIHITPPTAGSLLGLAPLAGGPGTVVFLGNKINGYGGALAEAVRKVLVEMYDSLT
jgi:hypothetical protein